MIMKIVRQILVLTLVVCVIGVHITQIHADVQPINNFPCEDPSIQVVSFFGLKKGYMVLINKELETSTDIRVKLDSGGVIHFGNDFDKHDETIARFIERNVINNIYTFILLKPNKGLSFIVKGRSAPEHPPYILSLKINGEENCINPNREYFGNQKKTGIKEFWPGARDKFCGRRRINRDYRELIVSGIPSKAGNWPWHVGVYRNIRYSIQYICGGTLLSKYLVLTAAHCVTINEAPLNPETVGVVLGRTSLLTNEVTSQEIPVYEVIVHDGFKKRTLDNDIALLKLSAEAIFSNFVQPACLWVDGVNDQLNSNEVKGTVVGWGIDQSDSLVNNLHEAEMPIASKQSCISFNPVFYRNILANNKKFCAGYKNGTAACNGDTGGGFVVFVPDTKDPHYSIEYKTGAFYVRGVISIGLTRKDSSMCDANAYMVFTDVSKYSNWISSYIK